MALWSLGFGTVAWRAACALSTDETVCADAALLVLICMEERTVSIIAAQSRQHEESRFATHNSTPSWGSPLQSAAVPLQSAAVPGTYCRQERPQPARCSFCQTLCQTRTVCPSEACLDRISRPTELKLYKGFNLQIWRNTPGHGCSAARSLLSAASLKQHPVRGNSGWLLATCA